MSEKKLINSDFRLIRPSKISIELFNTIDRQSFFKNDFFKHDFLKKINKIIDNGFIPIISCDIFDTILFRNEKSEPFRFFEISSELKVILKLNNNIYDILLARFLGTEISYSVSKTVKGCREGSIYEIHQGLLNSLNLSSGYLEEVIMQEIDYEIRNLSLNVGLWSFLLNLKKKNLINIIFISDTYLHKEHLEILINSFIPNHAKYVEKIYSSADYTVSKHSGHLFDLVKNENKYKPEQLLHIGDNLKSDYVNAKNNNWDALFLPIPKYQQEKIRDDLIRFKSMLDKNNIRIDLVDRFFIKIGF